MPEANLLDLLEEEHALVFCTIVGQLTYHGSLVMKLSTSPLTRSKLALISWATRHDSHSTLRNSNSTRGILEGVDPSYEESSASLLRVMRVYCEFERVHLE